MMANKPLRPCNKTGCPNLTRDKYCEQHLDLDKQPRQRNHNYDSTRKNAAQRGYDYKWQQYRVEFLKRNPTCKVCGAKATVVDHIIPHKGNKGLFLTRFNHQPLCKPCHDRKTRTQDMGTWQ